jgi:hypothetical protein
MSNSAPPLYITTLQAGRQTGWEEQQRAREVWQVPSPVPPRGLHKRQITYSTDYLLLGRNCVCRVYAQVCTQPSHGCFH